MNKLNLVEYHRKLCLYYKDKKWVFNKFLFEYHKQKYYKICFEIIDSFEFEIVKRFYK